ncbi:MAG TPA: hypothetical protein VJ001_07950 [Rhodocyclaceae bacterium]|nr:hypothetical protein [Rhodocyclaceae bacterium]
MTDSTSIAEAWLQEALRRSEELDLGLVETISAEEVRCEALKLLARPVGLMPEQTIAANVAGILGA